MQLSLRWGPRRRSPRLQALGGGPDLISTLPDDLLLLVLARLECASAAARTGVLSRRWRGLWARLRRIVLRDVPFHSLEPALSRVPPPPPALRLLEICPSSRSGQIPEEFKAATVRVNSLLRAAARIDPEEFSLVFPKGLVHGGLVLDLPCFHRATSIVLELYLCFSNDGYSTFLAPGVEFPVLESLSISCCAADFDALLSCCPRLRTLRLHDVCFNKGVLKVNSPLLQELVVASRVCIDEATIVAPMLKQLTMSLQTYKMRTISILAPTVETVSWECHFYAHYIAFGLWHLAQLSLQAAAERPPSLHIHARIVPLSWPISQGEAENFTQEIEKHTIAEFSVLELHLDTSGHVFGALAFLLLGMNRIRTSVQRLKILLKRSAAEDVCPPDCLCEPSDWRSQTIILAALEEVEISGFEGDEHEIDFLKLVFTYAPAPMLKRIIVKLSHEASLSNFGHRKIDDIFRACSPVEFHVSFTLDEYMFCRLD